MLPAEPVSRPVTISFHFDPSFLNMLIRYHCCWNSASLLQTHPSIHLEKRFWSDDESAHPAFTRNSFAIFEEMSNLCKSASLNPGINLFLPLSRRSLIAREGHVVAYAVQGRRYRLSRRRRGDPVRGCVGMGSTESMANT
jgi:hypothetical protein